MQPREHITDGKQGLHSLTGTSAHRAGDTRCGNSSRETLKSVLPVPKEANKIAGEQLLTSACKDSTRGNGFNVPQGRLR